MENGKEVLTRDMATVNNVDDSNIVYIVPNGDTYFQFDSNKSSNEGYSNIIPSTLTGAAGGAAVAGALGVPSGLYNGAILGSSAALIANAPATLAAEGLGVAIGLPVGLFLGIPTTLAGGALGFLTPVPLLHPLNALIGAGLGGALVSVPTVAAISSLGTLSVALPGATVGIALGAPIGGGISGLNAAPSGIIPGAVIGALASTLNSQENNEGHNAGDLSVRASDVEPVYTKFKVEKTISLLDKDARSVGVLATPSEEIHTVNNSSIVTKDGLELLPCGDGNYVHKDDVTMLGDNSEQPENGDTSLDSNSINAESPKENNSDVQNESADQNSTSSDSVSESKTDSSQNKELDNTKMEESSATAVNNI